MKISVIVATSDNNVIGKNNDMVWHMPADFKYFKEKTKNHIIIMGRKTFDSLGKSLKYRTNLVVTRNDAFQHEGVMVFDSLEKAVEWSKHQNDEEIFIIGGASIYKQAMSFSNRIYLTKIHGEFEGDTFFPELDSAWKVVSKIANSSDENNPYDYTFLVYEKD